MRQLQLAPKKSMPSRLIDKREVIKVGAQDSVFLREEHYGTAVTFEYLQLVFYISRQRFLIFCFGAVTLRVAVLVDTVLRQFKV